MKIESPSKFIIITIFSILAVLGFGISVASRKIQPEEIRKFITKELEYHLPNAQVRTSSIDFTLGYTSLITVNGLDVLLKSPRNFPLVHIDRLDFKIPFSSLIFGHGKIEVFARSPMIHFIMSKNFINWKLASNSVGSLKKRPKNDIPEIFKNSEINLNFLNVDIVQKIENSTIKQQQLEKIIIKDFGFKSSVAFEVLAENFFIGENENVTSFDLLMIGELQLEEQLFNSKIDLKATTSFRNITNKNHLSQTIKSLSVDSNFVFNPNNGLEGQVTIQTDEEKLLTSKVKYVDSELSLSEINFEMQLLTFFSFYKTSLQKYFKVTAKDILWANGNIDFKEEIQANLKFGLKTNFNLQLLGLVFDSNLSGEFSEQKLSLASEGLSGEGTVSSKLVWNDFFSEPGKTDKAINLNVSLSNVNLQNSNYNSLYIPESEGQTYLSLLKSTFKDTTRPLNLTFEFENSTLNSYKAVGKIDLFSNIKGFRIKSDAFKFAQGDLKFNLSATYQQELLKSSLESSFTNISTESLASIFREVAVWGILGEMSGTLKGDMWGENYLLDANFKFLNGELSRIDLNSKFKNLIEGQVSLGTTSELFKENKFSSLTLKSTFSPTKINVALLDINSLDLQDSLALKGVVNQNSELKLVLKTKKEEIKKILNFNAKSTELPLRMIGEQEELVISR